jgi:hypothetical protein
MRNMFAATGLVLVALGGVAQADSPGGWDQFTVMAKNHAVPVKQAQVRPVADVPQVEVFMNNQRQGTWVFPANPNQGAND